MSVFRMAKLKERELGKKKEKEKKEKKKIIMFLCS